MARFRINRPSQSRYNAKRKRSSPASYSSRLTGMQRAVAAVVPGYTRVGGSFGRYGYSARRLGLAPEKKYFDTALNWSFDTTAEVPAAGGQLVLIPQGDTESTRDGRKAVIESIQIRGAAVFAPAAATTASCITYMYVILDKQCNGQAAAVTDVFTSDALWKSRLELNNSGRFVIIKKLTMNFTAQAGVSGAYNTQYRQIEWFKKVNIPIDWSSTTGALTEIRSNNIFIIAGSVGGDDLVTIDGACRVRFRG